MDITRVARPDRLVIIHAHHKLHSREEIHFRHRPTDNQPTNESNKQSVDTDWAQATRLPDVVGAHMACA
jgi:hypothetical protein